MALGDQSLNFRITAKGAEAARELRQVGQEVGALKPQIDRVAASADTLATRMTGVAQALAGAFGLREIVRASDAIKGIDGRLRIFEGSADKAGSAFKGIFQIAQESGTGLEDVAELYGRFARNANELGLSQERTLGLTRTIALAMATSGGASASAAAAIMQFGQALGAGTLRGEELNSVLEQAPALADAIAKGMGRTTGELKAMGEQGLITVPEVIAALEKMRDEVEAQFALMPQTVAQGLARVRNAYLDYVRDSQSIGAASDAVASGLTLLARNFDTVATAAAVFAVVMLGRVIAAKLQAAQATLAQLQADQAARVAAVGAAQAAMRRAAAEQQSAQIALSAARANTASAQAQVAADRARLVSTAALIRGEIELEKTRLAAQINDIGRAQRLAVLASLSRQLAAAQAAEAKVGQGLAAVRAAEGVATEAAAAAKLRYAGATTAANAATAAAATGARLAGSVITALGGPIGALITVLGLASVAWTVFGSDAESAGEKAAATAARVEEAMRRMDREKRVGKGEGADFREDIARLEALIERDEALLEANRRAPDENFMAGGVANRLKENRAALDERRRYLAEIEELEGGTAQKVGAAWRNFMEDRSFSTKAEEDLAKFNELSKAYVAAIESIRQNQPDVDPLATPEGVQALERYQARLQELQGEIQKTAITAEEDLRTALVDAMRDGAAEAQKLKAEIASLLQQAADVRSGLAGAGAKAQERRDRGLTDEEREALNGRRANEALREAERMSVFEQNARIDGRAEKAQEYAQRAAELIKQASDYADRLKDDSEAASLFDRIAEAEASALEAQAAIKKQQLAENEAIATAQAAELAKLETRLAALMGGLGTPVSVQLDTTAAEAKIEALRSQLSALGTAGAGGAPAPQGDVPPQKDVEVAAETTQAETALDAVKNAVEAIPDEKTVIIKTVSETGTSTFSDAVSDWNSSQNGFAAGGWTGPGQKYQVAGVVHADEFVTRKEVVRQPGALGFLDLFNRIGMRALERLRNGYAAGGLVQRLPGLHDLGTGFLSSLDRLALPGFSSGGVVNALQPALADNSGAAGTPVVLDFGTLGRFDATAREDVADELVRVFRRAALQRGGRR